SARSDPGGGGRPLSRPSTVRSAALATVAVFAATLLLPGPAAARQTPTPGRASRSVKPATAVPSDRQTFRPTVRVRRGDSVGTGTLIAARPGEALVLTAAHVVADRSAPLLVELHRYNLGLERTQPAAGWPLGVPAEVVAADVEADVALLRMRGVGALPFT